MPVQSNWPPENMVQQPVVQQQPIGQQPQINQFQQSAMMAQADGIVSPAEQAVLNQQYQHTPYVASLSGGFMPLQERVIGESPATLDLCSVIDMNDAGQVAVEFCSNSYGPCAILTPARPGDANGDGLVNGTDLALILGYWGQYPTDGVCGPDLDMNGVIDGVDLTLCLGDWDV